MWDGSVDFSDFRLSGTWDVSSGVGHVNYYQVPSLPFLPNNKTDITFNILVTRKVSMLRSLNNMMNQIKLLDKQFKFF